MREAPNAYQGSGHYRRAKPGSARLIFKRGTEDITTLLYPTGLLLAAVLLVMGFGLLQRLLYAPEHMQKNVRAND